MIPTLTKLLAISNVANSSLGLFRSMKVLFSFSAVDCSKVSLSFGVREKKAVSAPENKADSISNIDITTLRTMIVESSSKIKGNMGGGSRFII